MNEPAGFTTAGWEREGDPRCTESACSPRLTLKLHSTLTDPASCRLLGRSLKRWPGTADLSGADPIAAPESGYDEACAFTATQGPAGERREIQATVSRPPGQPIEIAVALLER